MIQPETVAGRKKHFKEKRDAINALWKTDENGVVHIPLKDGYEALIDECDKEIASQFFWHLKLHCKGTKPYAETHTVEEYRYLFGKTTSLHRVVMSATIGMPQIDHKDGNGLNCRRCNLRFATQRQNTANRLYPLGRAGFRGVYKTASKNGKPWGAQIEFDGKNRHLGVFDTTIEAALCYNRAALEYFGEFATLNEITPR